MTSLWLKPVRRWIGIPAFIVATALQGLLSLVAHAQGGLIGQIQFVEPKADAVFDEGQPIPIAAVAFSPTDVFTSAEFVANGRVIGIGTYCCPLCPCAFPGPGLPTYLQIPFPHGPDEPPHPSPWQGWVGAEPGTYILTARATGENGISLESQPITIRVLSKFNPSLLLSIQKADGNKLQFALLEGAVSMTGFAMELSHDLIHWDRIGDFSPGNLTAFYEDSVDVNDTRPRFFRAVER